MAVQEVAPSGFDVMGAGTSRRHCQAFKAVSEYFKVPKSAVEEEHSLLSQKVQEEFSCFTAII